MERKMKGADEVMEQESRGGDSDDGGKENCEEKKNSLMKVWERMWSKTETKAQWTAALLWFYFGGWGDNSLEGVVE